MCFLAICIFTDLYAELWSELLIFSSAIIEVLFLCVIIPPFLTNCKMSLNRDNIRRLGILTKLLGPFNQHFHGIQLFQDFPFCTAT